MTFLASVAKAQNKLLDDNMMLLTTPATIYTKQALYGRA
jgi:hypothetical protein